MADLAELASDSLCSGFARPLIRPRIAARLRNGGRKRHRKRTAPARSALHRNRAMIAPHNPQDRCEPQPATRELGGEEGIEDTGAGILVHAAAGIVDLQSHLNSGIDLARLRMYGDGALPLDR